ncbi:unnamed protein product [marine sediment metagenome]|uniref:Uncharacterized protein n=1 Tax=marine sediment metagenome TaxID=412755 RepID=X1Q226_9ZZZZ
MSNVQTGKKCPKCGAEGRYNGEHETAVRNYSFPWGAVADVGWRCWNCGYEWGFEVQWEGLPLDAHTE